MHTPGWERGKDWIHVKKKGHLRVADRTWSEFRGSGLGWPRRPIWRRRPSVWGLKKRLQNFSNEVTGLSRGYEEERSGSDYWSPALPRGKQYSGNQGWSGRLACVNLPSPAPVGGLHRQHHHWNTPSTVPGRLWHWLVLLVGALCRLPKFQLLWVPAPPIVSSPSPPILASDRYASLGSAATHNTFNPTQSSTFQDVRRTLNLSFGSGRMSGYLGSDIIWVTWKPGA